MFSDDYKVSERQAKATRAFVNAAISNYNESTNIKPTKYVDPYRDEARMVVENSVRRENISNRYHTFSETVRNSLVTECIYKIYKEAVSEELKDDSTNRSIMRAIVNEYVYENGYDNIMNRMKTGSVFLSEMHRIITDNTKAILEEVDKSDPETFHITPEMKDEFFKSLDYSDSEAISDAIRTRVSDAMEDFITANTKDHEDITAALQSAQEKISDTPEDDTELRECYEMQSKRRINQIRNAPKGVLHSMISAMCESALKHPDTHVEFMSEGHLDMDKIVNRTTLMYTFMETLNTARIDKVDEAFIANTIKGLSE